MSKTLKQIVLCAGTALIAASCGGGQQKAVSSDQTLDAKKFETEIDGKKTGLYTMRNASGMEVSITNYGGRIVAINVPDKKGQMHDVVLGFDSIGAYLPEVNQSDFGAAIGRYANRINQGRINIDGQDYQLPQNNFGHCLHGGPTGWQYKVYDVKEANDSTVVLTIVSPDGDNNFPGTVNAQVTYTLRPDNSLAIAYKATTDKPTVINMTNHSYFNLNGDPSIPITNNKLYINADAFTPVDTTFMTTGVIEPVEGTPMDFTKARVISETIDEVSYDQISNGNGYDHNWVLNTEGRMDIEAAKVVSPLTGITLTVYTDEPGIQVYTGNFLDGTVTGKHGKVYKQRSGICLETQHYPDTPNKPEWPSVLLRPGETYTSNCIYKFGVEK